jgi:ERCC4-type nuclease
LLNLAFILIILKIVYKHGKYYKIEGVHLIKQKKRIPNNTYQRLNIIALIPFIGEEYAERLLKIFKTIKSND